VPSVESAYGRFHFPDPKAWPLELVENFRRLTEPRTLQDVFVFVYSDVAGLFMEDAITALSVLPVVPGEWSTELGYPSFFFDRSVLNEHVRKFESAGYQVWLMEKPANRDSLQTGKVVNIAAARNTHARRLKWA